MDRLLGHRPVGDRSLEVDVDRLGGSDLGAVRRVDVGGANTGCPVYGVGFWPAGRGRGPRCVAAGGGATGPAARTEVEPEERPDRLAAGPRADPQAAGRADRIGGTTSGSAGGGAGAAAGSRAGGGATSGSANEMGFRAPVDLSVRPRLSW